MGVKVRKKRGKWYIFVNWDGRRKARCVGTREAAERVKREIEARLTLGDLGVLEQKKSTPALREYADRWLREHAEVHCKPSTAASYRQLLRLYVYPSFGDIPIDKIERGQLKEFLASRVVEGKLSRNTLRLIVCTLRVIFNHAIEDGLLGANPAARLGKFTKTEKPERQATALTREEVDRLLNAAKEFCPEYFPLFLTAVRAGLRRGELVALRWGDIQFGETENDSDRYVFVQHNYVLRQFTTPKSKRPRRVDLSKELRRTLLRLRDERLLEAYARGNVSIADDLAFPSKTGGILDPDNLEHYYFLPVLERAGLRKIRFHDLRHTFGSLLIQEGAPLAYVKEQMGHSSIQVTVDTYTHLVPGDNVAWIDRLDSKSKRQPSATRAQPARTEKRR